MNISKDKELDLARTIRPGLDILANEIVIALKKRTRFVSNPSIYTPGLVISQPSTSLLDYELHAAESNHAELGRYQYAVQEAFTDISRIESVIKRPEPTSAVKSISSGVGTRILDFYQSWISDSCIAGTDVSTYGETVTSDVNALLAIMERVNLGKSVAESKYQELTDAFIQTNGEREAMLDLIVRRDRMNDVIDLAEKLADHYDIQRDAVVQVFNFMMEVTIDIEVDYIRCRLQAKNNA